MISPLIRLARRHRRLESAGRFCLIAMSTCSLSAAAMVLTVLAAIPFGYRPSRDMGITVAQLMLLAVCMGTLASFFRSRADALRYAAPPCIDCDGTGYLEPATSEAKCPRCHGLGRELISQPELAA